MLLIKLKPVKDAWFFLAADIMEMEEGSTRKELLEEFERRKKVQISLKCTIDEINQAKYRNH